MTTEHTQAMLPEPLSGKGFTVEERPLTALEAVPLYAAAGWTDMVQDEKAVERALANSLYTVCVLHNGHVVACARIVGDGGINFYIQDVIVLPALQGCGLGRVVFEACCRYLDKNAPVGAFVGLMAAAGAAGFYERYGFQVRTPDRPGMDRLWHT